MSAIEIISSRKGGDRYRCDNLGNMKAFGKKPSISRKEHTMEKKKAKWIRIISISALVLLAGAFALNGWAINQKGEDDTVLATVDDINITRGEVDNRISAMLGPQGAMLPPEKLAEIRGELNKKVLDSLIVEALLAKAIEKEQVTAKDEEIDAILTQLKDSLPADVTFEAYLKDANLTEKELRQTVRKNLGIQKLIEEQTTHVSAPADQEIAAYYQDHPKEFETPERVEVRHILIAVDAKDSKETKAEKLEKAKKIRDQVAANQGKDFEKVAKEVSDCPSKAEGGKLGFLSRGQTVKAFEDAAFSRKKGEIGPVVETRFGYHIIEVLDHKDAGKTPLSDVKGVIANHLSEEKKREAVHAYIESLKAAANIVFHNDASRSSDRA